MARQAAHGQIPARPAAEHAPAAAGRVLTVDVGNTTTRLGVFAQDELLGTWELTTHTRLTADEAWTQAMQGVQVILRGACGEAPALAGAFATGEPGTSSAALGRGPASVPLVFGSILACVVPSLTDVWTRALARVAPARPLVVGPGLKTGVPMRYDDPSEVGADRVADVVAARAAYGAPVVVVDLGTTTNFEVVDERGAFAGGIIAPGVALGARALEEAAARLPQIPLRAPATVIGKNTRAAMQSGVVLGEVARIDGLLDAVMVELGAQATVVVTGDEASAMAELLRHPAEVDPDLTLRGLNLLYRSNQR